MTAAVLSSFKQGAYRNPWLPCVDTGNYGRECAGSCGLNQCLSSVRFGSLINNPCGFKQGW